MAPMDLAAAVFLAGAAAVVLVAGAGAAWVRAETFSASDFADAWLLVPVLAVFLPSTLRGAGAAWAEAGVGVASVDADSGVDPCAEIRKSSIEVPRFFRLCLSQAGLGPRPLQVWPVFG